MQRILFDPRLRLLVGLVLLINLFVGLGSTPLWEQDEAAYAGFAHQMLASGDWRIPSFLWSEMHRKPPLHMWVMAATVSVFGEHLWAVRLSTVLAFVGTCVLLVRWGSAVFGVQRCRGAVVVLATSFVPVFGKVAVTDGVLLLAQTAAVLAVLNHLQKPSRRWCLALWVAVSLGVLIKGPPVLILVGGVGILLLIGHPQRKNLLHLHPWFFLPLAMVPMLVWGYVAWQVDGGETIRWMLDWYVLSRLQGGGAATHIGPFGYYFVTMAIFFFPWFFLVPAGVLWVVQGCRTREPVAIALGAWLAVGWLFYEVVPSKLPAYALGAYPAMALVIADRALGVSSLVGTWRLRLGVVVTVVVGLILVCALGAGVFYVRPGHLEPALMVPAVWLLLVGGFALRSGLQGLHNSAQLGAMAASSGGFFLIWLLVLPVLRPRVAIPAMVADVVIARAPQGSVVVFARNYHLPSLPLYLMQAGLHVREQGEAETIDDIVAADVVFVRDGEEAEVAGAVSVDGWIPDRGTPIRFWVSGP